MKQPIKRMSISGWFEKYDMLIDFLEYYYNNPQQFYQDRIIDSIYDSYTQGLPLVWCGGRIPLTDINPSLSMQQILDKFNTWPSIKLRHVFTNCLLDDDLINDYRCNQFMKKYIRPQDEIIVNHPKLIKHLQKNYPDTHLIYSTTLGITDIEQINQITVDNIFVMNYNKNNDDEYIKQLKFKKNIEILCGEVCNDNCNYRQTHYKIISQKIIDSQFDKTVLHEIKCPNHTMDHFPSSMKELLQFKHSITNERLDELASYGIQYFKITGRSSPPIIWLDVILYYLALPEYREEIKQMFLLRWFV